MPYFNASVQLILWNFLKMKSKLLLIFVLMYSLPYIYAQDKESLRAELYIAPDFGLMLGIVNRIEFSPAIGYYLTDRISIAGGFKYEFYSQTRVYSNQSAIKTHIFGPRAFARYTIINDIGEILPVGAGTSLFSHIELETSSLETKYFKYTNFPSEDRFWFSTVLVGGGFSQVASDRIHINFLLLWDTSGGSISLYNNPVIRFGFQFFLRPRTIEYY